MKVRYAITFILLQNYVLTYAAEISNLRINRRARERQDRVQWKDKKIRQVDSNSDANGPDFVEPSSSTKNNDEEVRLMIQWKQAVVDNAAAMYSDSTQVPQDLESVSFSKLLETKYELLNGKVPTSNVSSESSKNDEAVKVMLDSPRIGITAVAGSAEALKYYNLESHPAVKRVEIDVELETYGFVDNPPNDVVNEFGSNGNKRTLSKATRNMQSTDFTPYGVRMVQADQFEHHPTNRMRVCVVDTGMDKYHPDLPKQQHGLTGWNHPTFYGNEKWYIDGDGHGTHVAGTIAAIKDDVGLHGVEDDPSRFYLSIGKGLSDNGRGYSSVILDAVSSCVNNHLAKVVNLSLGSSQYSPIAEDVYKQMYNQGALIVAAAGNSGNTRLNYPASYSTVMSVSATNGSGDHAGFNTYNYQVEIAAPGIHIASTFPDNRWTYMSGTSMASPHVAGVALKVWSWFPECSNTQIRNVLLKSAKSMNSDCDVYYGYGIVQAYDALQLLRTHGCEAGGATPEPRHTYSYGGCQQLSSLSWTPSPVQAPPGSTSVLSASPIQYHPTTPSPAYAPTAGPTTIAPIASPAYAPTAGPTTIAPIASPTNAPTELTRNKSTGTVNHPTEQRSRSSNDVGE